ncbi:MAG: 6-phospho-beta-glucosidase, partial [Bacillota bacterium]
MKVVVVGGGSSYTPELVEGLIAGYAALPVSEFCLADIPAGKAKLAAVAGLGGRMIEKAGLADRIKITQTLQLREALPGADFVISQFRVGGLAARVRDERIPLQYGITGQETTGPGGFAQALRSIPAALDLARAIERLCPAACLINFTNPAGILTEALCRYSTVRTLGLCNIPLTMRKTAAAFLNVDPERLSLQFTGLNHLSFITRAVLDGEEITDQLLASPAAIHFFLHDLPGVEESEARALLNGLRLIPSPYLRYYYFPEQTYRAAAAQAASAGTRGEQVAAVEAELFALYADPSLDSKPPQLSFRGGACYSAAATRLMAAVYSDEPSEHVLNMPHGGAINEMPAGAVVETNCLVRGSSAAPLSGGALPLAARGLIQQVKAYEQLTVEAAAEGDRRKAYLALLNHPLVKGAAVARSLLAE